MKIAFSGTHGTGKTTSVLDYAKQCKIWYPNSNVEVLTEIARKTPLNSLNKNGTEGSQLWMFTTQISQELNLMTTSDILITDRSLLDYIAYTYYISENLSLNMVSLTQWYMNTYDIIYFKTIENNDYLKKDGVRDDDLEYRKNIEDLLLSFYYEYLKQGVDFKFEVI